MPQPPNVLMICSDQLRADCVGNQTYPALQTPNLNQLVADGISLPNTFCNSPICMPARACMLSGQYATQTGILGNSGPLPPDKQTWAKSLSQSGYSTVCIGRAHDMAAGFDRHIPVPIGDSWFNHNYDVNGPEQTWTYSHDDYEKHPYVYDDFENYHETRIASTACHFLRDLRDIRQPWGMYVGFMVPHNPYIIPAKYHEYYQLDDFALPDVFDQDKDCPTYNTLPGLRTTDFTEKQLRHMRCMYFEMVTMLDELVGRVLQTLDDLGMADNTIVVFTSDHGEMLGDHGRVAKICFYDQALRVPLIIRHPAGMKKGQVRDALSEQTDLMPTILDLADIDIPSSVAGKSLAPVLRGESADHKDAVFSAVNLKDNLLRCIRTRTHRLSYGYQTDSGVTGELFDLTNDPAEQFNRYSDQAYAPVRQELFEALFQGEAAHGYKLHSDHPEFGWRHPVSQHLY